MMAVFFAIGVPRWRSRQLYEMFSCPSANHVCSIFRAFVSQVYSRLFVGSLNHDSDFACSSQKPSGSLIDFSHISLYWASDEIWAFFWIDSGGGNVRLSVIRELMAFSCVIAFSFYVMNNSC